MAAPDHGLGTTVTFGTSAFSASIMSVEVSQSRASTDTTHMGTTGARTSIPFDLLDNETMTMEIQYDGSLTPPIDSAAETITIDWGGVGIGHTTAFTGYGVSFSASAPIEDLMTGTLVVQRTGAITIA